MKKRGAGGRNPRVLLAQAPCDSNRRGLSGAGDGVEMKRYGIAICVAAVLLVCGGEVLGQAPDLSTMDVVVRSVPDGPVATVNGTPISAQAFVERYQEDLAFVRRKEGGEVDDAARVKVAMRSLGSLIEEEILLQEAAKRKVSVTEKELSEAWQKELRSLQLGLAENKTELPTEGEILEMAGADREQVLEQLRRALLIEKTRKCIAEENKLSVTDAEVEAFFTKNAERFRQPESVHIKQMFFRADPRVPAQREAARKRAETALMRVRSGQSFEAVARSDSDPPFRDAGGDMPAAPAAALPGFLAEEAGKLKPDEVSEVVESEHGFHIVKLVEISPGKEPDQERVLPIIKDMLYEQKTDEAVKAFCKTRLEDEKSVEVFLELERQLAFRPDVLEELGPQQ